VRSYDQTCEIRMIKRLISTTVRVVYTMTIWADFYLDINIIQQQKITA